jgi:hypothetical protein
MTTKINAELVKILSKDKNLRPEAEQILERLSISKDTAPTLGQKESLLFCCKLLDSAVALDKAIQQTLEKAKEKPDAEYVPNAKAPHQEYAQQRPINEAQLKEIAARYSLGDRISEITSALQLKTESITTEQFEQFRVVCEQVQQGIDLGIVAQGVLNKAQAKPSVSGGGTALTQRKESAPTTTRPMPELVEQSAVRIEHTPLKGEASDLWNKIADIGASADAETLATSPFDGIKKASVRIRAEANALEQHGEQIYFEKFGKAFNDPALLKKVAEQNLGKFPKEWDLSSKIQL